MGKITELPEKQIEIEDVFYLMDNKCDPKKTTLQEILDKYALEFAGFCESRDTYLERITLEDLLKEFKEQYIAK